MTETEFEKAKRKAREELEQQMYLDRMAKEMAEKPIERLDRYDVRFIRDIPHLQQIIRESDEDRVVEAAIDRIYGTVVADDIRLIRECLPGKCTYTILQFLAEETKRGVYSYILEEKLVRTVVPALQKGHALDDVIDLLDTFFHRKYNRYCNFEEGCKYPADYYQILEQIDNPDPWEAFKNIDSVYYERLNEIDDSDEFSYISSQDDNMDDCTTCGYTFQGWRWKLVSEANLLIDGVD